MNPIDPPPNHGPVMKRRTFLFSAAALTAGAMMPAVRADDLGGEGGPVTVVPPTTLPQLGTITEPARKLPIVAAADVVVVGGGPAGTAAAIAAARAGVSVILVERYNHLGGLWTGGLVLPLLATHGRSQDGARQQVLRGIGGEIVDRLLTLKMAQSADTPVPDPEATKYVLEALVHEAGVRVLYHCWAAGIVLADGAIRAVVLESKSGRVAVTPKVVVDCTGDGDIFAWAGEPFDTLQLPIGLVHRLGNTDRVDPARVTGKKPWLGGPTAQHGVHWVNMSGERGDALNLFTLSELQQRYRLEIWRRVEQLRATPGYEQVYLLETAPQLGVRLTRLLRGQYRLTLAETMTDAAFPDTIGIGGAWTVVTYAGKKCPARDRPCWAIPYRTLVPPQTRNLLVAGRCVSCEPALTEDSRVIGTCLITGHGAGAAAAVAAQSGAPVQRTDITKIQKLLREQRALLG